ncbi:ImmA/IrrE family metallo-endopeptidase [Mesobacillus subterraneus]|uniref:ImmA/IrrE family metallo-endopeptidase n=1 Tax=Mesobacillus subterraneus TaxID=285983 RepID=UPI001CFD157E|nr:ImmA/IrrE family metallo-endopeptidase [Mesobacillus subterraneus]WLR54872.1 ImmA/IrrE family metallo-endopeptidase [Mesobacillus subterraneus]
MSWVKEVVKNIVARYNTSDPFELASLKKIEVVELNLHDEIKGFYKYDKRNRFIVLNSNLESFHQKFVCAHELGHAELHSRLNTPFLRASTLYSSSRVEVEANTFAVELLIPDNIITKDYQSTIFEAAAEYGVPREVVHLKNF